MINGILSRAGAKYVCFDIKTFYLSTPLGRPDYLKIQLSKISQEFIKEYNLNSSAHKVWVYFEIRCGCYGLPQYGILANKKLILSFGKRRLLWGQNYTGSMETQMETNIIMFNCRWLWSRICWETTCLSLSQNPQKIPQYHQRLGRKEIFWYWFKMELWKETM